MMMMAVILQPHAARRIGKKGKGKGREGEREREKERKQASKLALLQQTISSKDMIH